MKRAIPLFTILSAIMFFAVANSQPIFPNAARIASLSSSMESSPLVFTENRGQWNDKALFRAEASGATFWFCQDEVICQYTRNTDELIESVSPFSSDLPDGIRDKFDPIKYKKESMILKTQFIGANPDAAIISRDRLSHNNNYFYGNDRSKWAADVPNYSSITYRDIYPSIDLVYHGNGRLMKYDFIIEPGADISKIRIRYDGVDNIFVTSNGDLQANTRFGLIYENIPSVYQQIGSRKSALDGRYVIVEQGVFGFEVENYNPELPLIIDPELAYSTYLGGNGDDVCNSIAVDYLGYAYITGSTSSSEFPQENPYQPDQASDDVFITKLSPDGDSLIYSTYLGGSAAECGYGIAIDISGNAYISGRTFSSDFPTENPYQTDQPDLDVFVTKLSPAGNSIEYSTYLGGGFYDWGYGIAVDELGSAYVTGNTSSVDYPTENPYQLDQPSYDVFVTKLSPDGGSLEYSTYLGGANSDDGISIAVDVAGSAYITGVTYSENYPVQNQFQNDQAGYDAFVTKLSPEGNALIYSTYLAGGDSFGLGIAVDGSGNAYVTGFTYYPHFPIRNPYQTYQGPIAFNDAFLSKLSHDGDSLVYSTYLGGNNEDWSWAIALDDHRNVYVTGFTCSPNFPTLNPYQTYQSGRDAFVTMFSSEGNSLYYSTILGGPSYESGYGIGVDGEGHAYIGGYTCDGGYPIQNPYQTYMAGQDAVITKLDLKTAIVDDDSNLPADFSMMQNYPNPFNAQTTIKYSIAKQSDVTISIFDILGRKIASHIEGKKEPGNYQVIWDATGIASGIYFYKLTAADYQETKRMTLLK